MDFLNKVMNCRPTGGEIAIFWLGQAGFIIKYDEDKVIAIDPYLSNCVERIWGFKRIMMPIISPMDIEADILLVTHHHEDHLDVDSIPFLMECKKTKLYGPNTVIEICKGMKIPEDRLTKMAIGDEITAGNVTIKALYADHGELAPDAIGMLLTIKGIKIYITGDTAYRPEYMQDAKQAKPDIIIMPINGAFGNLGPESAAKMARDFEAKVAIPGHYWMFKEHNGNPQEFENKMKEYAPQCMIKFMCQGEEYRYESTSQI